MSQTHTPLNLLKRKYTRKRHEFEKYMAIYAEMLHEKSRDGDYFRSRIKEMKEAIIDLEQKFIDMGGNVSCLD
jgi:hypothetical protein